MHGCSGPCPPFRPAAARQAATLGLPCRRLPGGITPSSIIKGCWQLSGGHRGDPETDRTSGKPAVEDFRSFVDAGITTFDSGPEECGYGPSESIVGDFVRTGYAQQRLQAQPRARRPAHRRPARASQPVQNAWCGAMQVNSKLCCVGAEQRAFKPSWAAEKVDRTLGRLGVRTMGLMQLYWNDYGADNYCAAALALTELRAAGKIGGVAYTNFDTERLEARPLQTGWGAPGAVGGAALSRGSCVLRLRFHPRRRAAHAGGGRGSGGQPDCVLASGPAAAAAHGTLLR